MRIDAHQHYWKLDRGDYGWITPEITSLYRDFSPVDLAPLLKKHQIDQTILVQAAPTLEETEFILELSEKTNSIAGVVGWLDLEHPNYRTHFEMFSNHPKFVGFRLMIQDMDDASIILTQPYVDALTYFSDKEVPVDLLVVHHQLPVLIELLEKVPHLRGVVDHIGKPAIGSNEMETWKGFISQISTYENVYCKLSGMITEASHEWKEGDFVPYIQHVLQEFGTLRVMFGSDWPVCLLKGSYEDVVAVLNHALPVSMTEREKDDLFGGNAARFYKL
ncbi:amidohydrolase family protein [Halalkalibacter kiskunsagensis]|uniref:Amidohydrolase family protein n=1 Tax=Halalkalibacter kiskunsagensis TaxID=1548599 RepID=A0ABV6KBH4_9BACI